jgi:hypothetical protein
MHAAFQYQLICYCISIGNTSLNPQRAAGRLFPNKITPCTVFLGHRHNTCVQEVVTSTTVETCTSACCKCACAAPIAVSKAAHQNQLPGILQHHSRVVLPLETHEVHLVSHTEQWRNYYLSLSPHHSKGATSSTLATPTINALSARRQPCHSACTKHTTHLQMTLLLQQLGSRRMQRSSLHHPATPTAVPAQPLRTRAGGDCNPLQTTSHRMQ